MEDDRPYVERLRTDTMKKGRCELCNSYEQRLEGHHEKYRPERKIYVCHKCHHKLHFLPWQLPGHYKVKLLQCRHGFGVTITDEMIKAYVAPGRRAAQLRVRMKVREGLRQ